MRKTPTTFNSLLVIAITITFHGYFSLIAMDRIFPFPNVVIWFLESKAIFLHVSYTVQTVRGILEAVIVKIDSSTDIQLCLFKK